MKANEKHETIGGKNEVGRSVLSMKTRVRNVITWKKQKN
jgi:hypothetical protein